MIPGYHTGLSHIQSYDRLCERPANPLDTVPVVSGISMASTPVPLYSESMNAFFNALA